MRNGLSRTLTLAGGLAAGAGVMYLMDPKSGERRRRELRKTAGDAFSTTSQTIGSTLGSLSEHANDLIHRVRRSDIGEKGIEQAHEVGENLSQRAGEMYESARQTGQRLLRRGQRLLSRGGEMIGQRSSRRKWLIPGVTGVTTLCFGLGLGTMYFFDSSQGRRRRDALRDAIGSMGRRLRNTGENLGSQVRRGFFRAKGGMSRRGSMRVHKTLVVDAPVERVFQFWTDHQNFPRFMSDVREVRDLGGGRTHWTTAGPGGSTVEWDSEVTKLVPNRRIAWRSLPGSGVNNSGQVTFQPAGEGLCRIDLTVQCAGVAGQEHGEAEMSAHMDEDLTRLKNLLETGNPVTAGRLSGV